MIVPRNSLLVLVALVMVPVLGIMVAQPQLTGLMLLLLVCCVLLVAWDAWRSWDFLDDLSLQTPEVLRLAKGREDRWSVILKGHFEKNRQVRFGFGFPQVLGVKEPIQEVSFAAGEQALAVEFVCQPTEAGSFHLKTCYLEAATPFGFWNRRREIALEMECRVYLDLMRERKIMAVLFLNREGFGIHAQRQVGQGRDFEKLRRYIAGDSLNEIHWKATAKRGFLVTKEFRVERTQEVYVVVDGSRLSARQAVPDHYVRQLAEGEQVTVLERYLTAALILGLAAEKQGDLFGVVGFAEKVQSFVRAKAGRSHFANCRDALFGMQPRSVSPDPAEMFRFLRQRLRRRALLIVLTHLDDPLTAESFVENITLLSQRHLVVVAMIKDRQMRPMFSGGQVEKEDEVYEALGAHMRWRNLKEVGSKLAHKGVQFSLLDNEGLCLDLLTQYINIKQRQLI